METPWELELTEEDCETIAFVGGRYSWSSALDDYEPGLNYITEAEGWRLREAFEEDDALFPLLDPDSELWAKLNALMDKIV